MMLVVSAKVVVESLKCTELLSAVGTGVGGEGRGRCSLWEGGALSTVAVQTNSGCTDTTTSIANY